MYVEEGISIYLLIAIPIFPLALADDIDFTHLVSASAHEDRVPIVAARPGLDRLQPAEFECRVEPILDRVKGCSRSECCQGRGSLTVLNGPKTAGGGECGDDCSPRKAPLV